MSVALYLSLLPSPTSGFLTSSSTPPIPIVGSSSPTSGFLSSSSTPPIPIVGSRKRPTRLRASMGGRPTPLSPVANFPYLPSSQRELMVDLLSVIESQLGPHLLPSAVPADVLSYRSPSGTSHGALDIRSGGRDSTVDFILNSWLHCELPTGALNITTLFAFLNASTDAPHLLVEFIQSSLTSLILIIDFLPRRDLVLHPDYLDEFYQQTNLDKQRQELTKLPPVQTYYSPSLYVRSIFSPAAIAVNIKCGDGQGAIEDLMQNQLASTCKDFVRIWVDTCASRTKQPEENEIAELIRRDRMIKIKVIEVIEIDFAANMPRIFTPEVAERVVKEIQKAFKVSDNYRLT